jgi:three-Cys-motif partner protein
MAINRMLTKSADRNSGWESRIDRCFGTTEWRALVYPEKVDMFGETSAPKAEHVPKLLLDLYMRRLKTAFGETASPREIRNTKGAPLYYLIWAGPHPAGLKGAEYILGSGERLAAKRRGM